MCANEEALMASEAHYSPTSPPPFMVGMAEVEVDVETGKVTPIDYVALGSKIHYVIEFILGKQFVGKHAVADVTFYKKATFVVNVIGNGAQIACVGQGIQYHHFNIIMFCQDIFNIVGADKTGGTGYEISLHEN